MRIKALVCAVAVFTAVFLSAPSSSRAICGFPELVAWSTFLGGSGWAALYDPTFQGLARIDLTTAVGTSAMDTVLVAHDNNFFMRIDTPLCSGCGFGGFTCGDAFVAISFR